MILVAVSLLGLLTVPLAGGRLSQLAQLQLQQVWAVWASITIQLRITAAGPQVPVTVAHALHLLSYALAAWCLWSNRLLPGVWLVAAGGASNLVAIAANGGSMPATAWAWRTSGLAAATAGQFENSAVAHGSRLWFLGDVLAVPQRWPFANVFSVGDVIIVIGLLVLAHRSCRRDLEVEAMARSATCVVCTPTQSSM